MGSVAVNHALIPVIVGGGMTSAFVAAFVIAAKSSKAAWLAVDQLAGRLGLTMAPPRVTLGFFYGSPRASGERRGKQVEIFSYVTGSGKSQTTWVAVSAKPRTDGGLTFELQRQGFATKIAALFGAKEIEVGDPAFDARWFIQTNRPDYFGAALLPELRAKLDAASAENSRGTFKLERGKVIYAETGRFDPARAQRFERVADLVCDLADVAEVCANDSAR